MREEKQELSAKVSQLLDENRKLSTSLARSTDTTPCITDDESSLEPEVSRNMVTRLQDALESQRDQLHQLQQQYQLQMAENDQLSGQVERLTQSGKDLRRRARQSTQQIRFVKTKKTQLVEERAELHVTLQEQQRTLDQLQQRLGLAAKENYDLATASIDTSDMSGKLVYDRNDPNRPRFTLTELKDILYQRNELKARLSDLEDELNMYRPSNASAAATKQQYVHKLKLHTPSPVAYSSCSAYLCNSAIGRSCACFTRSTYQYHQKTAYPRLPSTPALLVSCSVNHAHKPGYCELLCNAQRRVGCTYSSLRSHHCPAILSSSHSGHEVCTDRV
ncbi:hypothetical protein HAZT_HAZT003308 [Hyalella azteca]|uniref:RH2 domain-containing protein n=1 Tax=Hyalella azteca TaxID=294128 RepID=A0A6A0GXF6_HYAAZ|nr:hypothetical protein HAZT_HAZT003308 [Hyalella azteca]